MGRFLIALAAFMGVAGLLAVALAPGGPTSAPLPTTEPLSTPEAAPALLRGRASEAAAEAGPSAETPAEESCGDIVEIDGIDEQDAPPDPVERGDCTLVLQLISDADDEPLSTKLDLWRIGEPGNAHWTAGDRKLTALETQDGRATAAGLAPGRYRIHAHGQRKGSKDPAVFAVAGEETVVALRLPTPRRFQVRLRIYDPTGSEVTRGRKQSGGVSSYSRFGRDPGWVEERDLREGFLNRSISLGGGCGSGGGRGKLTPVEARNGTFDMLTMRESERRRSWSRTWHLHPQQGTKVSLYARSDTARDRTFVGVTLPLADLHDAIRLPDGTRAIDAGASIRASCSARLVPATGIEPDWRDIPIEVNVRLAGYGKLTFKHTLALPLEDRTLVPHVE